MADFETLSFEAPGAWAQAAPGRFVPAGPDTLASEGGTGRLWSTREEPGHTPRRGRLGLQNHHEGSRVLLRAPRLPRLT
jgi:hypothetical protein